MTLFPEEEIHMTDIASAETVAPAPVAEPAAAEPAPVEPAATEPVTTTEPAAEPSLAGDPGQLAPDETPPAAAEDPFAAYGGKDAVEAATRMYEATRTQEGVVDLFIEAGKALGLNLQQMQALFGVEETPPEEVDPDEPLTIGQFQEMQRRQEEEAQRREQERIKATATKAVQETTAALGLKIGDPVTQTVLQLADQHVAGNYGDYDAVAKAIRQGHADFQALVEQEKQKALQAKHEQAQQVPSAPSGGAPAADPGEPEPKDVSEAIKQVRKRLGLSK